MESGITAWLERQELVALHRASSEECRAALGLTLIDTGPALVSIARNDGNTLLNRAVGLGLGHRVGAEAVRDVVRVFAEQGIPDYFIHLDRGGVDVSAEELSALGLEQARSWRRFTRGTDAPPEVATDLEVRRLREPEDAEYLGVFGRIAAQSFGMSPLAGRMFEAAGKVDSFHLFMSFDGKTPAGTGGLLVVTEPGSGARYGWLDMGATLPDFRKRGGQSALIVARIRQALELGCTRIFTETGEPAPGDPQHSYKNLMRCGFTEGSVKENWRPKRA